MLMAENYMGHELVVPAEDRTEGDNDQEGFVQAVVDLSYDIAHKLEFVAHFFTFA
jgi:hypothetical protein